MQLPSRPTGVGETCSTCKWLSRDGYCEHTTWVAPLTDPIPEIGCMTYQAKFGTYEPKENSFKLKGGIMDKTEF